MEVEVCACVLSVCVCVVSVCVFVGAAACVGVMLECWVSHVDSPTQTHHIHTHRGRDKHTSGSELYCLGILWVCTGCAGLGLVGLVQNPLVSLVRHMEETPTESK